MSDETIKNYKRHARAYHTAKALLATVVKWLFQFEPQPAPNLKGPYLVLGNHNADLDPALIQLSFRELLYFVASEHIFRVGLPSRLLVRYFDPISRLKGSADMSTVRDILRRLKDGKNICIFAEGNRSFNGITGQDVPPSIGKLVKLCKVPLVTYRFEGGYFTTPRWAYTMRRGRMVGYVVSVYTPDQLKEMSVDEINAAVAEDLFEDAYARQAIEKVRFKGKRLAEGLETALFICPKCQQIGTLKSRGSEFYCQCGLKGTYDEYGYLHDAPYTTIAEWDNWQNEQLVHMAVHLKGDELAFGDDTVRLIRVLEDHKTEQVHSGALAMYRDRIVVGERTFALADISDMALYGRGNIAFTSQNQNYVITSKASFCGRKYLELYNKLASTR